MIIELLGSSHLLIKDTFQQVESILPRNVFIHRHPLKANHLVINTRASNQAFRKGLEIDASKVTQVGYNRFKGDSKLLHTFLVNLLLSTQQDQLYPPHLNGLIVEFIKDREFNLSDSDMDGRHFVTTHDSSKLIVDSPPSEDMTFKITNGSWSNLTFTTESEEEVILYDGQSLSAAALIPSTQTVEVAFSADDETYTITNVVS